MNPIIEEIYQNKTSITIDGREIPLTSAISRAGGEYLFNKIKNNLRSKKTLEVGCAHGLSSLYICEALKDRKDGHHTIIDPFQTKGWQGVGITSLKRAGFENFTLMEELSEIALPSLLKEHEGTYDFIFIDGWHTFDHLMIDCFYASRLLKVGGLMAVDDTNHAAVAKAIKYFQSYPCYRRESDFTDYPANKFLNIACRIGRYIPISSDLRHRLSKEWQRLIRRPNIVCLKKMAQDERSWYWYKPF